MQNNFKLLIKNLKVKVGTRSTKNLVSLVLNLLWRQGIKTTATDHYQGRGTRSERGICGNWRRKNQTGQTRFWIRRRYFRRCCNVALSQRLQIVARPALYFKSRKYVYYRVEWFSTFSIFEYLVQCTHFCWSGIFLGVQFQKSAISAARQSFNFEKITGISKLYFKKIRILP